MPMQPRPTAAIRGPPVPRVRYSMRKTSLTGPVRRPTPSATGHGGGGFPGRDLCAVGEPWTKGLCQGLGEAHTVLRVPPLRQEAPSRDVLPRRARRLTVSRPILLTVDDDPSVSRAVARDLRRRYGETHRVIRADSGA